MGNELVGSFLKKSRKKNNSSVQEVSNRLFNEYGVKVAVKTLYGWEVSRSQPDIETFLALCQIYNVTYSDLNQLGYRIKAQNGPEDDILTANLTTEEREIIQNFRHFDLENKKYLLKTIQLIAAGQKESDVQEMSFVARNSGTLEQSGLKLEHMENLKKNMKKNP